MNDFTYYFFFKIKGNFFIVKMKIVKFKSVNSFFSLLSLNLHVNLLGLGSEV